MILILSLPDDGHVEAVTKHLDNKGVKYRCFSYMEYPCRSEISFYLNEDNYAFRLNKNSETIDLLSITSVWNRRPEVAIPHNHLDKRFKKYVEDESSALLNNLYLLTQDTATWLPSPVHEKQANNKPYQLYLAHQIGFKIPQTYIGNSEQDFDQLFSIKSDLTLKKLFFSMMFTDFNLVQKSIQAIQNRLKPSEKKDNAMNSHTVPTQKLDPASFSSIKEQLSFCPVIIQDYIQKQFELRVTVLGEQVFACAIHSQEGDEEAQVDYRSDTLNLRHEIFDLPVEIKTKCISLLKHLGLNFGCFDFIVTNDGEFIFLEVNPNGQWLWLEYKTGLPISEAIADYLIHQTASKVPISVS